jgi:hypothetical protein
MLWQNAYPIINDGKNSIWQFGNARCAENIGSLQEFLSNNSTRGEFKYVHIIGEGVFSVGDQGLLKLIAK